MDPDSFGDMLRRYRTASGFSQEHLAERAGVSVEAVSTLERGARRGPHRATIALLAQALGLGEQERSALEQSANRARARVSRKETPPQPGPAHNLPARYTSFVGREPEIAAIGALLEKHRLLTVTGSGGVGKTSTVLELASRLRDTQGIEVWFVDLAPLRDGAYIVSKIASVLRPVLASNCETIEGLLTELKPLHLLLILDNCEHLITDAATTAKAILETCPQITIVATSRERLGLSGEALYRLPSLSLPNFAPASVDEARSYAALELFIERAASSDPSLTINVERAAIVADICRRLDGIPLAIELAVARLPSLGLATLRARLNERFVLPSSTRDLPLRQRTMLATIEWSYNLLSDRERLLLQRLSIFAATLSLDSAEAVCSGGDLEKSDIAEQLAGLVDKSLVNAVMVGESRRYVLLASVRAYGVEQLAATGEFAALSRRHAQWMAEFADREDERYLGMPRVPWLHDVWPEFDNVRAALEWSLASDSDDDAALAGRIVGGLRALWNLSGQLAEVRRWTEAVLERVDEDRHPLVVAKLLRALFQSMEGPPRIAVAERAIPLFERLGQHRNLVALSMNLAIDFATWGRTDEATAALERASTLIVHEQQGSPFYASFLLWRSVLFGIEGRFDEARASNAEATRIAKENGDDFFVSKWCMRQEAAIEGAVGNYQRAIQISREMLAYDKADTANGSVAMEALGQLAFFSLCAGELDSAAAFGRHCLNRSRENQPNLTAGAILTVAAVRALRGEPVVAARLRGFVAAEESKGNARLEYPKLRQILDSSLEQQLARSALDTAIAAGAQLTTERAIEEALATP